MGGIIFFKTQMLHRLVDFYTNRLGMIIWLEQPDCTILKHQNLLIGFCQREVAETEGMITFIYDEKEDVDKIYNRIKEIATDAPHKNQKYRIYQFFALDPEGRALEFQVFLHKTPAI